MSTKQSIFLLDLLHYVIKSSIIDSCAVFGCQISNDQKMDSTSAEEERKEICKERGLDRIKKAVSFEGRNIVAIPFSEDQIPYLKDKRGHLKKRLH